MLVPKIFAVTLLSAFCSTVRGAQILGIFPTTAPSHYILGNALMRGLAEAGHNVTVISPFEEKDPPKAGSYRDVVLTGFREELDELTQGLNVLDSQNQNLFSFIMKLISVMSKMNYDFFAHENVQGLLRSDEKFDVVIIEQAANDLMKVFGYIYNVPIIVLSTSGVTGTVNSIVGNPSPLSYIPQMNDGGTSSLHMSFTNRLLNVLVYLLFGGMRRLFYFPDQSTILQKYFPDAPDFYDLHYNVSLILLNYHESLNQPVPVVPNMVQIGGYHVRPPKKLPKDLQEYLDNAKEGVVYFSLGSTLKSKNLLPHKREALLTAFGKLKQTVLWKWEDDDLPGKPLNVKLAKWLPQQDILAHPNVRLFITHCGLLSTTETVYHGVPILAIPIFADQYTNAKQATLSGYALSLPYETPSFSEEKLSEFLHELLTSTKYRDNAKKISQLFHDRPLKPMDSAVYWVEYVIRNRGAPHLKVAGVNFSWFKYHSLDVISFLVATISITVVILYITLRKILNCWGICDQKKNKSKRD